MKLNEIVKRIELGAQVTKITHEIQGNVEKIKEICDTQYSNRVHYGHTALNRMIVKDGAISELLTPDTIRYRILS